MLGRWVGLGVVPEGTSDVPNAAVSLCPRVGFVVAYGMFRWLVPMFSVVAMAATVNVGMSRGSL